MDQILLILKQLTSKISLLTAIPKPVKVSLTAFTVVLGIMAILKYAHLDRSEKIFLIIAIVLLAVITGAYYGMKALKESNKNKAFGGEISQHASATPRGVSDLGQRARLDD